MPAKIEKIIVATDFNDLATAAVRFAGHIAEKTGAELIGIYADTFEPPPEFTAQQVDQLMIAIDHSRRAAHEELERHLRHNVAEGVKWKAVVVEGPPATAILAASNTHRADLLVMGTHGRGGIPRMVLGSVAERVMRDSTVPVLTVHTTTPHETVSRIICPVNDTPIARQAAEYAGALAHALAAELTLLHVANGTSFQPDTLAGDLASTLVITSESARGDDAQAILDVADRGKYDLIVIGAATRGTHAFGTTTTRVTRHARTPVLTLVRHAASIPEEARPGAVTHAL